MKFDPTSHRIIPWPVQVLQGWVGQWGHDLAGPWPNRFEAIRKVVLYRLWRLTR